jgi:FRG domain
MTTPLRVRSVSEFIDRVAGVRDRWNSEDRQYADPWFRGVSNVLWDLQPSVFRWRLIEYEGELRAEFARRGGLLMASSQPRGDWEWYFLMQHYRAPTRLLDWTDSALVALFFALNSNEPESIEVKSDAAVWILDPWWLNRRVIRLNSLVMSNWDEARPYLPPLFKDGTLTRRLPIAIDPSHIAERVRVQRSRFTVHGWDPSGFKNAARDSKSRLVQIAIARSQIDDMRLDLATCGITDNTVFPDLEGLARDLRRYFNAIWWQDEVRRPNRSQSPSKRNTAHN